jgi:hypothetical protein
MSERVWAGRSPDCRFSARDSRRGRRYLSSAVFLFLGFWGTFAGLTEAQQRNPVAPSGTGAITGRVVDSETRLPLQGASVFLERVHHPAVGSAAEGTASPMSRAVVTGADGRYHFAGLDAAEYLIVVARLGYVVTTVVLDLRAGQAPGLSVGLEVDPITLAPLRIISGSPEPYGRTQAPIVSEAGARLLTDRLRQERYLVADAREMTHAEVIEAITLAETDLFRALQRVPGVNTRDDYTATLWTRGAPWDQTRVFFDGLPLYNPTHAGWLFSAVNPDAIGAASFHPGFRSARWGEGAAAVLDLRSRSGRNGKPVQGNAELSVASARLALDGELSDRGNWMLAARRSHVDLLSGLLAGATGKGDLHVPYDFSDVVGRLDGRLGGGWHVVGSGIIEYDHLRGEIPGLLKGNRGSWGNRAGSIALSGPIGPLQGRISGGGTNFSTVIYEKQSAGAIRETTLPALENAIGHRMLTLEIEPAPGGRGHRRWVAGFQAMRDSVSYDGPFSLLGALVAGGARDSLTHAPFTYGSVLSHNAAWAEHRWSMGGHLHASTGMRLEFGDSVHNGGRMRWAPRLAVRADLTNRTALTGGWSRAFQYTQDISPAAGPIGPQLHLSAIWVLASPARAYPAVRSDVSTVGLEHYWGDGWGALFNLYRRDATGLKIPNPAPGPVTVGRDPDAEATNEAVGYEVTARRIGGRWTASLGYTFGRSHLVLQPRDPELPDLRFPASADIRHGVDAMGILRLSPHLRTGAAFTFASGVPFTRLILGDSIRGQNPPRLGEPYAERTPPYASLDAMVEYSRAFRGLNLGGYLQLRNVVNRTNAVTYSGSRACTETMPADIRDPCADGAGAVDQFERGLPRLPLVGIRLAF